jgi:D-lactate dehydrogenase (cytochrome)
VPPIDDMKPTTEHSPRSEYGSKRIHARAATGDANDFRRITREDEVSPYLEDAARYPGGHCEEVFLPRSEAALAFLIAGAPRVLAIGVQSSLTGGATPDGGRILSLMAMTGVVEWQRDRVTVGAGTVIADLEAALAERGLYYPPVPTYDGATIGGTFATNAAGAATFKYGSTRDWVEGATVVLASGDVLDLRRGDCTADAGGFFEIVGTNGETIEVPVPTYRMPAVAKRSAGYYADERTDLLDLLIGSEGTLAVATRIKLRLLRPRPSWFCAFVPLAGDGAAIELAGVVRKASLETRRTGDSNGMDVAAIEYMDRRCLELLKEDRVDERLGISWPADIQAALLVQMELPGGCTRDAAFEELGRLDDPSADSGLLRLCRLLVEFEAFDVTVPVLPGEEARRRALFALREAVPEAVNRRIAERGRASAGKVSKSSGDVIVPFENFARSLGRYRAVLDARGLDHATWGHISDGNVHPNVIVRDAEEMDAAKSAQKEIGRAAIELGGCPMSEHGVGRNPIKKRLLEDLYGSAGIEQMIAVKRAFDPEFKLAPGVIFDV